MPWGTTAQERTFDLCCLVSLMSADSLLQDWQTVCSRWIKLGWDGTVTQRTSLSLSPSFLPCSLPFPSFPFPSLPFSFLPPLLLFSKSSKPTQKWMNVHMGKAKSQERRKWCTPITHFWNVWPMSWDTGLRNSDETFWAREEQVRNRDQISENMRLLSVDSLSRKSFPPSLLAWVTGFSSLIGSALVRTYWVRSPREVSRRITRHPHCFKG